MSRLIDDLLAFSRSGRVEMNLRRVDLNDLIKTALADLTPDTEDRRIVWKIHPLPVVQGDPALLRQVWVNLLSNAIKYTAPRPEAHIEIGTCSADFPACRNGQTESPPYCAKSNKTRPAEIGAAAETGYNEQHTKDASLAEPPPPKVTLFVRDNGVGFDPQYAHKLFGVFQRLHQEDEFEGIGVGLALVRRIIKRHGGQIWAAGKPNHGATFYLTLKSGDS